MVAKLDASTFDVIATLRRPATPSDDSGRHARLIEVLESDRPPRERLGDLMAGGWSPPEVPGGSILDADNRLLVPDGRSILAYADAEPQARFSGIRVAQRFNLPASIAGRFTRLELLQDGAVAAATSAGSVIVLARGFSRLATVLLPHAPGPAHVDWKDGAVPSWVRGGPVADDRGGLYVTSPQHLHRVSWDGWNLSAASADGAWSEPVGNLEPGATPVLVGGGTDGNRLVAVRTDGTLVLLWRDVVPGTPGGTPGSRIAARQTLAFDATGAAPARLTTTSAPVLLALGDALLVTAGSSPLPLEPDFRAGVQKWIWEPQTRTLARAWSKNDIGAVSGAPVLQDADPDRSGPGAPGAVWFVSFERGGTRLVGLDWKSGDRITDQPLGGARCLSPAAVPILDTEGRLVTASVFGVQRIVLRH